MILMTIICVLASCVHSKQITPKVIDSNSRLVLKVSWMIPKAQPPKSVELKIGAPDGTVTKSTWTTFSNEPFSFDGMNVKSKSIRVQNWFKSEGVYKFTVCTSKCVEQRIKVTGRELKVVVGMRKDTQWQIDMVMRYWPSIKGVSLLATHGVKNDVLPKEPTFTMTNGSAETICSLTVGGYSGYFEKMTNTGWRVANENFAFGDSTGPLILKPGDKVQLSEHLFDGPRTNMSGRTRFVKEYRTGNCFNKSGSAVWDVRLSAVHFSKSKIVPSSTHNTTTR